MIDNPDADHGEIIQVSAHISDFNGVGKKERFFQDDFARNTRRLL